MSPPRILDPLRLHIHLHLHPVLLLYRTYQAVFSISSIRLSPRLLQRPCFTLPNSVLFAVLVSTNPGPLDLVPLQALSASLSCF
jgi:hypothetical protein